MRKFIMDTGHPIEVQQATEHGQWLEVFMLPRYAVWGDKGRGKPEVIEVSDDLDYLQTKYGPGLEVVPMGDAGGDNPSWPQV